MKNKKGMSQVVSMTLLILLTLVLIGTVWTIIDSFLDEKMDGASNCLQITNKIKLNPEYTCYDAVAKQTLFSITVEDVEDLESIIIFANYETDPKTIVLDKMQRQISQVLVYPSRSSTVTMPQKDQGRTFIITRTEKPNSIEIAPKIGNKQCDYIDKVIPLPNC